jgi:hypothetical protein
MLARLLFCILLTIAQSLCSIQHRDVWACIVKDKCINKYQLHAAVRHKTTSLRRQFLMAVEGAQYHRLYEDCDVNKDGCISMDDIVTAGKGCQRSCVWRQTMHDLLC